MKKQNGITLVAVIITVIVMLIIAGVSITSAINKDSVLEKTHDSVEKNKLSTSKEYITEAWAFLLSKVENNEMPYSDSAIYNDVHTKAKNIIGHYLSTVGEGSFGDSSGSNYIVVKNIKGVNQMVYYISFKLKGEDEPADFYVYNDKVYSEEELNEL